AGEQDEAPHVGRLGLVAEQAPRERAARVIEAAKWLGLVEPDEHALSLDAVPLHEPVVERSHEAASGLFMVVCTGAQRPQRGPAADHVARPKVAEIVRHLLLAPGGYTIPDPWHGAGP